MLEHLFGSKTRVKLITLFIKHQEEAFFIRELTRRIDTQINAVRREIDNLARLGLIIEGFGNEELPTKRPGLKRKYYQINAKFPLLPEIQSLMNKANFLMEKRLDKDIVALGTVSYLSFMGSFIGQKNAAVDLFIVGVMDADKLKQLVRKSENELGFEINFTCLTPQEYKYRKEISDKFLTGVLSAPQHVVIDVLGRGGEASL